MEFEKTLIKAPYENVSKIFRSSQKEIEQYVNNAYKVMQELSTKSSITQADAVKQVDALVTRLQTLKRKVDDYRKEEISEMDRVRVRIDHLDALAHASTDADRKRWEGIRLDRALIDFMLREGQYEAAANLAQKLGITDLVDLKVFDGARVVIEGLKKHDCTAALAWCKENSSKLKKLESTFEFSLRMQEFIEIVRRREYRNAVTHARKFLSANSATHMADIEHAMGALAFKGDTQCPQYKPLFDVERWSTLIDRFKEALYQINSLTPSSLLEIALQLGLSCLKTPFCGQEENRASRCPVCTPLVTELARDLPYAHHVHSTLVCRISGKLMNEHNPPLVLPNGYVYSTRALEEMAEANDGVITCPRTGEVCSYSDCRKAFVL